MPEIAVMVDSACDLDPKFAEKSGIRILPCHIQTAQGEYLEGIDFTSQDVFDYVKEHGELPSTSQVTPFEWMEAYREAVRAGKRDILVVTMNAAGSGNHASALRAADLLGEEDPELARDVTVRVVDSTGYSVPVAFAVQRAMRLIERGASAREAEAFLNECFCKQEILLGLGTLDYAKKSGRLSTVAAFVGEVLGLKPILSLHTTNKVVSKARGERAMIERLADLYFEMAEDPKGDYVIAYSSDPRLAKLLVAAVKKRGAGAPVFWGPLGTSVIINTGPNAVGIGFCRRADPKDQ